jgi:hypothetical protein
VIERIDRQTEIERVWLKPDATSRSVRLKPGATSRSDTTEVLTQSFASLDLSRERHQAD